MRKEISRKLETPTLPPPFESEGWREGREEGGGAKS